MDGLALIGDIASGVVERTLNAGRGEPGLVRFVLHALSLEEIVAIVDAIQGKSGLAERLAIALPRYAFDKFPSIAPENLTDISTTDLRHAECDREGRLIALIDDSQGQSLAQVDKLDASALLNEASAESWIDACTGDLDLPPDLAAQWVAAIRALIRLDRVSMRQIANYVIQTAQYVREGERIMISLGRALPELRLPRFDALFDEIPSAQRSQPSQWQKRFVAHWRRECFIAKRDATQIPFSTSKLREHLESQQATFTEDVYAALQAYVNAPPSGGEAAFAPFLLDWPEIRSFFEETKRNDAKSIAQETRAFYALQEDGLLSEDNVNYLDELDARGRNPSKNERDEEFFAGHAAELRQEPRLSALWDRFVFGPEVPCVDLIDGLLQCVRRLRQNTGSAKRVLVVEGNERAKGQFLGLNDDVCRMFATRYCGLEAALDGLVAFRHTMAFRYPSFADEIETYARRTPNAVGRKAR